MPVAALGGSTQHFRAYGKRKVNVINRRQPYGGWDASPVATTSLPGSAVEPQCPDSDSSSDSSRSASHGARKTNHDPCTSSRADRRRFEIVLEPGQRSSARPSQAGSQSSVADKENPIRPAQSAASKVDARGKATSIEPDAMSGEESEEQDANRPRRARPALRQKVVYGGRRKARTVMSSSSSSSSSEEQTEAMAPAQPGRRRKPFVPSSGTSGASAPSPRWTALRTPIVDSDGDSGGDQDELVEDRPSRAIADEDPSSPESSSQSEDEYEHQEPTHRQIGERATPSAAGRFPLQLRPLQPFLLSPTLYSFSSFMASPPTPFSPTALTPWHKIGEASFSEVFATIDDQGRPMVVKIIPVTGPRGSASLRTDVPLPFVSSWDAVQREIEVSKMLGGGDEHRGDSAGVEGFVRFKGAFLVQGAYPAELLAAWDAYRRMQCPPSDEQVRPDVLPTTQIYALLLLDNAGQALETYRLKTWTETAGVLTQVVDALGRAEALYGFEHRDLHWGNILVQSAPIATTRGAPGAEESGRPARPDRSLARQFAKISLSSPMGSEAAFSPRALADPGNCGIRATLIDFTLSRCHATGSGSGLDGPRILFDLFDDESLFEGEGDYQFEVYRLMRALIEQRGEEGWRASETRTNILWLHYLVDKLVHSSRLRPPLPSLPASPLSPGSAVLRSPSSPPAMPSPRRRAPVPRRPVTRRLSAAFPPSTSAMLFHSPLKVARARTLPTTSSNAAARKYREEDEERERHAYAALRRAEKVLEEVVAGWGLSGAPRFKARATTAAKGTKVSTATTRRGSAAKGKSKGIARGGELGEGGMNSAGEFGKWWFEVGQLSEERLL